MSRSTVSVVLNGVTSIAIAAETQQRVLDAARELGYVPSAAGRQLASGKSRTIGLVITYSEHLKVDAFVPQALYSLNEAAHHRGFRVLVEALEDVTKPRVYDTLVQGKQIDGLIVLNPRADDRALPNLIQRGFPVVVIGHAMHGATSAQDVDVDNVAAARSVTEHLLALGRTRIAHIPYAPIAHHSSAMRLEGWRTSMQAAGLDASDAWVEVADFSAESGELAMARLLERVEPDAVFAGNDVVAFGAMTALRAAGRDVPGDVAVAGFDDIPLARHAMPPLTTVQLPAVEMGRQAAERLIARIEGTPTRVEDERLLPTELVVRASTVGGGQVAKPSSAYSGTVPRGRSR